jgi:hypothetical protein
MARTSAGKGGVKTAIAVQARDGENPLADGCRTKVASDENGAIGTGFQSRGLRINPGGLDDDFASCTECGIERAVAEAPKDRGMGLADAIVRETSEQDFAIGLYGYARGSIIMSIDRNQRGPRGAEGGINRPVPFIPCKRDDKCAAYLCVPSHYQLTIWLDGNGFGVTGACRAQVGKKDSAAVEVGVEVSGGSSQCLRESDEQSEDERTARRKHHS